MQTVSSEFLQAFAESDIYLNARVVVEFGNNRFNDGQVVTASSTKQVHVGIGGSITTDDIEFWKATEAFNNKNRNTMKWLVCDRGATIKEFEDGTGYRAINIEDGEYERGWWSAVKSDGSGNFGTPQWVQSEFFEEDGVTPFKRRVNKIVLYTTEGYANMKSITVSYKHYINGWTDAAANYTLGASSYMNEWTIPEVEITGLRVRVHSTYDTTDFARISELQGLYVADVSADVVNIDISEARQEYDTTVPVGITSANTVNIELDNTEGKYNMENTSSTVYPYIVPNNKLTVELAVDINQGIGTPSWEYVPYGEFWVDEWANDSENLTTRLSGRDFSKFIQDEVSNITRTWTKTNIRACFYDLIARQNFGPERIHIDPFALQTFDILYLKDQSIWSFMQEVAFADQGVFGFDRNGDFYYHSYNKLNSSPHTISQFSFSDNTNIVSASLQTEIFVNKVIVRVSPYNIKDTGLRPIWSVSEDTILTWARCGAAITYSQTTIPVIAAPNQDSGNLTENNWSDSGYLWLPIVTNGELVGGEIVKYNSRTTSAFTDCERGYFNTVATQHPLNRYIGEVNVFDIEFDNAPALRVEQPFVTAIDGITLLEGEAIQASVLRWDYNSFGGKLIIGNLVPYYTLLSGEGVTYKDKYDGNTNLKDDTMLHFATVVAGLVAVEKTGKEQIGRDAEYTEQNKDYIRRYGKNELQIDNSWIQSKAHAEKIADILIDEYRTPRQIVRIGVMGYPPLETADRVRIVNMPQLDIVNKDYHIVDISIAYDGGLTTTYTLREVKP